MLSQQAMEARQTKQQNRSRARNTIKKFAGTLDPKVEGHIFEAKPLEAVPINPADPVGLHAYMHVNGVPKLPDHIEDLDALSGRKVNRNKVHTLRWRHKAEPGKPANKEKVSTMFPQWMPPDHVRALVGMHSKDLLASGQAPEGVFPEATRKHVAHGLPINLKKAGKTIYPTRTAQQ